MFGDNSNNNDSVNSPTTTYISNNVYQYLLLDLKIYENSNCSSFIINDKNKNNIINENDKISLNIENQPILTTIKSDDDTTIEKPLEFWLFFNKNENSNNDNNNNNNSSNNNNDNDKIILKFFKINSIRLRMVSNLLYENYYKNSNNKDNKPLLLNDSYKWLDDLNYNELIPNYKLFKNTLILLKNKINNNNNNNNKDGEGNENNMFILEYSIILSTLERLLGDIIYFKLINEEPTKQPIFGRMLRDLLDDSNLLNVLGLPIIALLKVLIGPPIGLNLRNIIWHGFISPNEFNLSLLLYIIHLIFSILNKFNQFKLSIISVSNNTNNNNNNNTRPIINLNNKFLNSINHTNNSSNNKSILINFKKEILQLLENSNFIVPGRINIWKESLNYYFKSMMNGGDNDNDNDENNNINIFYSLVLLLPQLEHSLRLNFVKFNNLPNKFLLADYVSFYTTLDLFISNTLLLSTSVLSNNNSNIDNNNNNSYSEEKHLQIPTSNKNYSKYENPKYFKFNNNSQNETTTEQPKEEEEEEEKEILFNNQLVIEIGKPLVAMLLDLFIYIDGPRIRDKLSHGEIKPLEIPFQILDQIIILSLCLSLKMMINQNNNNNENNENNELFKFLKNKENNYKLEYHTVSITISRFSNLIKSNNQLLQFFKIQLNECIEIEEQQKEDDNEVHCSTLNEYIGDRIYKSVEINNELMNNIKELYEIDNNSNNNNNINSSTTVDSTNLNLINLFFDKSEIDLFNLIRKLIKISNETILEYYKNGYSLFEKVIINNSTIKRIQTSFYKWIGSLNSFLLLTNILIIELNNLIYNNTNNNIFEKFLFYFEKLLNKIKLLEWDNVLKIIYSLFLVILPSSPNNNKNKNKNKK